MTDTHSNRESQKEQQSSHGRYHTEVRSIRSCLFHQIWDHSSMVVPTALKIQNYKYFVINNLRSIKWNANSAIKHVKTIIL